MEREREKVRWREQERKVHGEKKTQRQLERPNVIDAETALQPTQTETDQRAEST